MVAKLVLALIVLTVIVALLIGAAFLYFRKQAELKHEEKMKQMDRDEKIWDKLE